VIKKKEREREGEKYSFLEVISSKNVLQIEKIKT
jgi:hypothetical protein